jgi:hypothetical protein
MSHFPRDPTEVALDSALRQIARLESEVSRLERELHSEEDRAEQFGQKWGTAVVQCGYLRELMAEAVRDFHGKSVLFGTEFLDAAEGKEVTQ